MEPEKKVPFSRYDQSATMAHVGSLVPLLLREAVDDGFFSYVRSRAKDVDGWVEYSSSCRANMLYDRIAASARDLCNVAASDGVPDLRWQISANLRATEIMLGPFIVFRMKRIKKSRKDLTASVATRRQKQIRTESEIPFGQMSFDFINNVDYLPLTDRIWVTFAFDLDDLEESIIKTVIGVESRRRWLWRLPVQPAEADVIATLPRLIADRIDALRQRRVA